jgi:hypothetical protein
MRGILLPKMQWILEVRWISDRGRVGFTLKNERFDIKTGKSTHSFVSKYRIDPIDKFRMGT